MDKWLVKYYSNIRTSVVVQLLLGSVVWLDRLGYLMIHPIWFINFLSFWVHRYGLDIIHEHNDFIIGYSPGCDESLNSDQQPKHLAVLLKHHGRGKLKYCCRNSIGQLLVEKEESVTRENKWETIGRNFCWGHTTPMALLLLSDRTTQPNQNWKRRQWYLRLKTKNPEKNAKYAIGHSQLSFRLDVAAISVSYVSLVFNV